jgi:hypothetical protein
MPMQIQGHDDMLPEYDFSQGERGRYFKRYQRMRLKFTISARVASKLGGRLGVTRVLNAFAREDLKALKELMKGERPLRRRPTASRAGKKPSTGTRRRTRRGGGGA